jgi:pimeloyl-ACP methyl ester carboxylesterase
VTTFDDIKLAMREMGEGDKIVLLHGFGGSISHWEEVAQDLQKKHQVLIPNLSHLLMGKERITFSGQVEVLYYHLKKHLQPGEKAHFVGCSYGGALVWGLALKHPEIVSKVVFVNPMPPAPTQLFSLFHLRLIMRLPLSVGLMYFLLKMPLGKMFLYQMAEVFRIERNQKANARMDNLHGKKLKFVAYVIYCFYWIINNENWQTWNQDLGDFKFETLLICDNEDPLFSMNTYKKFSKRINCNLMCETDGAGHMSIQTIPVQISQFMQDFLESGLPAAGNQ